MITTGTHVPLIVNWQGTSPEGKVCDDLIDFTDFLPTLTDLTGASLPQDRIIDGHSFYHQIRGEKGTPREWIFCHYWGASARKKEGTRESVRDKCWKLYDDGSFYDLLNDPLEHSKLETLSDDARIAKERLEVVFKEVRKN